MASVWRFGFGWQGFGAALFSCYLVALSGIDLRTRLLPDQLTLPLMWPAIVSSAILIFTIVFDDFVLAFFTSGVSPQPLSVRIYSAIRFGIQPSINAVGTLMLLGSILLIAVALVLPRLLGRRGSGLDLFKS